MTLVASTTRAAALVRLNVSNYRTTLTRSSHANLTSIVVGAPFQALPGVGEPIPKVGTRDAVTCLMAG